jgi:hypothetical protein
MASSINASTSAGVITTADTSGVLNIQTAGTTAISIDASQAVSFTNSPTVTGGTANGVAYLNGSKALTTGSALTFDGTVLTLGTSSAFPLTGSKLSIGNDANSALRLSIANQNAGASSLVGIDFQPAGGAWKIDVPADTSGFVPPMYFKAGASTNVTFAYGGNVGIGLSNPTAKFDVNKLANDTITRANAAGAFGDLFTLGAGLLMQQTLSSPYGFALQAANAANTFQFPLLLNPSGGNVGIGQTSPAFKLDVQVAVGNAIAVRPSTATGNAKQSALRLYGSESVTASRYAEVACFNDTAGSDTNALTFSTGYGATIYERARISSDGNLGIGTSSPNAVPDSGFVFQPGWSGAGNSAFAVGHASGSAGGSVYAVWYLNSTSIGSISQSGTTAVAYNTSSDYRLKNTITPMTNALAKVAQLKPCTYKWNADGSDGQGFIAHELAEVVPQCVTGEKDAVNEDGSIKSQGIDTSFLVATLTAAIQELKAEFDAYKASHP